MQIELVNLNRIRTGETFGDESVGGGCGEVDKEGGEKSDPIVDETYG